ncbi:hypothetical protein [Stappia sp. 28M-7]|jgi:predicted transcriptional regulator|uniref:hypothetical protein n=1 Tax=Stappia sp. 28M-7 TaxID=2762596 RepID=UPI000E76B19E|nr:hypothetical protein [Stappia sp. 28M-7]MBC2858115.1 hypothetical protein [Stappia sp. 28M-7]
MAEDTGRTGHAGDSTAYRMRRLLETYYDLTLQISERLHVHDMSDVLMLVLVAIADLRGAPMDAELLAEKLDSSRSTIERRLKPYLDDGRIAKERRGKSVVYLWSAEAGQREEAPPDMSVEMVRAVMAMVFDIAND